MAEGTGGHATAGWNDNFTSLGRLNIPYAKRRETKVPTKAQSKEKEMQSGAQVSLKSQSENKDIEKEKHMEAFPSPFGHVPEMEDYLYPISIQNVSTGLDQFRINEVLDDAIKQYAFGYVHIHSPVTTYVLTCDLQLFNDDESTPAETAAVHPEREMAVPASPPRHEMARAASSPKHKGKTTSPKHKGKTTSPKHKGKITSPKHHKMEGAAASPKHHKMEAAAASPKHHRIEETGSSPKHRMERVAGSPKHSKMEGPGATPKRKDRSGVKMLINGRAKLSTVQFSPIAFRSFATVEHVRSLLSLSFLGETSPVGILTGYDDILGNMNEFMPSVIVYDHLIADILSQVENLPDAKHVSRDLRDCPERDPIIYYWHYGIIKPGYVYWLLQKEEKYYLHDLTATFSMQTFVSQDPFEVEELCAIWSGLSLLYVETAKRCWLRGDKGKYYLELMELCERVQIRLDRDRYPMEWCTSCAIKSDLLVPLNANINEPSIIVPVKNNKEITYELRMASGSTDVYNRLQTGVIKSLSCLETCLSFLKERLQERGFLPIVDVMPPGTTRSEYHIKRFAADVLEAEPFHTLQQEHFDKLYLTPFIETSDDEIRMVVHLLRKLYLDCIVLGRMYQRHSFGMFSSSLVMCRCSLSAWVAMASIFSSKKVFPLPLHNLHMMGDIFYKFSYDETCAKTLPEKISNASCKSINDLLDSMTTIVDHRADTEFKKGTTKFRYGRQSFECFARAVLYTEVYPARILLVRICVSANDLNNTYLKTCDVTGKFFTSMEIARDNFGKSKLLTRVAVRHISDEIEDRKIIVSAHINHGRHLAVAACYSHEKIDDTGCADFMAAFRAFNSALAVANSLGPEVPIGKDIATKCHLDGLLEYIWLLKKREDNEEASYHMKIFRSYRSYFEKCADRLSSEGHGHYFRYMTAIGCGTVAEYLYGLSSESSASDIDIRLKSAANWWFDKTEKWFRSMGSVRTLEILKTTSDRMAFFEFIMDGLKKTHDYDVKTMVVLLNGLELIETIVPSGWLRGGNEDIDKRKKMVMTGVLKAFESRLLAALKRRNFLRLYGSIVDIPEDRVTDVYRTCLKTEVPVLQKMINVLREIKTLVLP